MPKPAQQNETRETLRASPDNAGTGSEPHRERQGEQRANARDAAVAASLALQFGCPLEILRRALLRDSQGRPSTPLGAAIDAIGGWQ
jgi:hypothetical protein